MRWLVIAMLWARGAAADTDCRAVELDFTSAPNLQIVAWIEDAGGYVDTIYITQTTGLRGLGNRSGIMEHSGPKWPYGARRDVLPIWAHRHGIVFPEVVWSWDATKPGGIDAPFEHSSFEPYYNHPTLPEEWDALTSASAVYTDNGRFSGGVSLYPPRGDLTRTPSDSTDSTLYAELDVFDAISQATPTGDVHFIAALPELPNGNYMLRIEVAKEFDFNASYTPTTFPDLQDSFQSYGLPYRGQPSVLYEVPFRVDDVVTRTLGSGYVGYSDIDGVVHAPDATITADVPGSGALRLHGPIGVTTRPEQDLIAPAGGTAPHLELEPTHADIHFTAPGDDDMTGTVAGYDIRYTMGYSLDAFDSATPYQGAIELVPAGQQQLISIDELRPATPYVVAIRPYDNCKHDGPLLVIAFQTPTAEVSACGCRSGDAGGFAIVLAAFGVRRRRRVR